MTRFRISKLFAQDERGVLAPLFAIALAPLMTLLGITVDYSRANSERSSLQAAIDSAALMLSKEAVGLSADEVQRRGDAYVRSLMPDSRMRGLVVQASMTQILSQYRIDIRANGNVKTEFGALVGQTQIDIGSTTQVVWGTKRLELALALDNTGSMAGSKITALRDATLQLINILQASARRPEDVRISIIPFDRVVNVGTGPNFAGQPWFDMNGSVVGATDWRRFHGCVTDRDQPNDTRDTNPTTSWAARFVAAPVSSNSSNNWQRNCDTGGLTTMLPLTNDWNALRAKANQMRASGNTNVSIGVAWGMHSLTSSLPMVEAETPKPDLEKYMIVLTDGENTQNRWTTNGNTIDARTLAACTEAKAQGIKVYTVRVINGDADLLRSCATSPSMYYDVQNVSGLVGVFGQIAGALSQLYIAK
jgi:Flp pilus assembly protein TadG